MLQIRKAEKKDKQEVIELYKIVIEQIKDYTSNPEWIYGKYPKKEHIVNAIESGELYVGMIDNKIVSSIVINNKANEGYENIKWKINTTYDNIYVIHLVVVNQDYKKQGFATEMLKYAFDLAEKNSIKSIRLSLNTNNLAIEKIYTTYDFNYVDSMKVFIEDRGIISFKVYEKIFN